MVQESSLYYQLSTIRSSKLQLNQNNLNQLSQLATYNYQLNLSEPQYRRYKVLLEKKLVSQWEFDQVNEQYLVYKKQKELFLSTYTSDSISRANQLEQISMSEQRMIESLKGIRNTLNDLTVRAPISGQLSTPKFEVGQTMNQGTRIGQVYVLNKFELNASVDETYLSRVAVGQAGSFELDGRDYRVKISKVYPAVNNGVFQVDMNFAGEVPVSLTGGQNVYLKLEMSNPYQATLLSLGSFYNKTGGKWVYVIDSGGDRAQKRNIRVGNKNPLFYEVLDGLKEGEQVITSSYDLYKDYDILILK
jgi:HlyD family secretion protein